MRPTQMVLYRIWGTEDFSTLRTGVTGRYLIFWMDQHKMPYGIGPTVQNFATSKTLTPAAHTVFGHLFNPVYSCFIYFVFFSSTCKSYFKISKIEKTQFLNNLTIGLNMSEIVQTCLILLNWFKLVPIALTFFILNI